MEKKLNVYVHGETDWLSLSYNASELDKIPAYKADKSKLCFLIGNALDGDVHVPIEEKVKEITAQLIAVYVSQSKAFKIAKQVGMDYILITAFRSSKASSPEYIIRIAGITSSNNFPYAQHVDKNKQEKMMLLESVKANKLYLNDSYHINSAFHEIMTWVNQTKETLFN